MQAAKKTPMLDFHAAIHYGVQAGGFYPKGGFFIPDPDLLPQNLRADRDCILGQRQDEIGRASCRERVLVAV